MAPLYRQLKARLLFAIVARGIDGAQLAKLGGNETWAPFAKYATRIAIAPIFSVPYVESSITKGRNLGLSTIAKARAAE